MLIGSGNNNYRIINTDGRGHAGQVGGDDDNPLYYGRSVGKWEGDTLVVDTRGFNEDFWFTNGGLPHTDQLRLLERFSRPDFDTLKYDVTIEDPGAYTRPWSSSSTLRWVAGEEMPRHLCQDNRIVTLNAKTNGGRTDESVHPRRSWSRSVCSSQRDRLPLTTPSPPNSTPTSPSR